MAQTYPSSPAPTRAASGPALAPAGRRRRAPNPRSVRRWYKAFQWVLALIGAVAAAIAADAGFLDVTQRGLTLGAEFYALALLIVALGFGLPWLLVGFLWRWHRDRKGWEIS